MEVNLELHVKLDTSYELHLVVNHINTLECAVMTLN